MCSTCVLLIWSDCAEGSLSSPRLELQLDALVAGSGGAVLQNLNRSQWPGRWCRCGNAALVAALAGGPMGPAAGGVGAVDDAWTLGPGHHS